MVPGLKKVPQYWGTATLAKHWWCHQQLIFEAREEEETYKQAIEQMQARGYGSEEVLELVVLQGEKLAAMSLSELQDRLAQSGWHLGEPTQSIPKGSISITVGRYALFLCPLESEVKEYTEREWRRIRKALASYDLEIYGDFVMLVNHASERVQSPTMQDLMGRRPALNEDMAAGVLAQRDYAEQYRHVRAFFAWKDYLVMSAPDGLGENFAYEFKNSKVIRYQKPVALAQANLYAYFYDKPMIRVQIRHPQAEKIYTYEESSDPQKAETLLERAEKLLKGEMDPMPPKKWKCRPCKFSNRCSLSER